MTFNPNRIRKWPRRILAVAALVIFVLMWKTYGWRSVPIGVDTMPEAAPAGALCLIKKAPRDVKPGSVVFVRLPENGGLIVARIKERRDAAQGESYTLTIDNPQPRIRDLAGRAIEVDARAVESLVLTAFPRDN